jgi:hypothetical protein
VGEDEVLSDVEAQEELRLLEGPGQSLARAELRARRGDVVVVGPHASFVGPQHARQHGEQGGLPAPFGPIGPTIDRGGPSGLT